MFSFGFQRIYSVIDINHAFVVCSNKCYQKVSLQLSRPHVVKVLSFTNNSTPGFLWLAKVKKFLPKTIKNLKKKKTIFGCKPKKKFNFFLSFFIIFKYKKIVFFFFLPQEKKKEILIVCGKNTRQRNIGQKVATTTAVAFIVRFFFFYIIFLLCCQYNNVAHCWYTCWKVFNSCNKKLKVGGWCYAEYLSRVVLACLLLRFQH